MGEGFFCFVLLVCWGFSKELFRIVYGLVSILAAQFVTGNIPSGLNDALLRLSPVELY